MDTSNIHLKQIDIFSKLNFCMKTGKFRDNGNKIKMTNKNKINLALQYKDFS